MSGNNPQVSNKKERLLQGLLKDDVAVIISISK